jgi:hypothetical protein
VQCPKCGRGAAEGAFICAGCDFILDASFLGDDITDDQRDQRAPSKRPRSVDRPRGERPRVDFGEDAMILGNPDEDEVSEFRSRDAGVSQREVTQARFYIGGAIAHLMQDNAVPELVGVDVASMRVTPFERHVLGFVNGKRSIARIAKKAAVDDSEFKTAIAMLADKGFIRLKGFKKPRASSSFGSSSFGSSSFGSSSVMSAVAPEPSTPRSRRPLEGERTVVASMEHIEALARRPPPPVRPPSAHRVDLTSEGDVDDGATRVAETPLPPDAFAPTPAPLARDAGQRAPSRFSSLSVADARGDEPGVDPDGEWAQPTNRSSVFSESRGPPMVTSRLPSLVDADPEDVFSMPTPAAPRAPASVAPVVDVDDDGFDEHDAQTRALPALQRAGDFATRVLGSAEGAPADAIVDDDAASVAADADPFAGVETRVLEKLRDPTGLGDDDERDGADGAPVDDDDDGGERAEDDDEYDEYDEDEYDEDEYADDEDADDEDADDEDADEEESQGAVGGGDDDRGFEDGTTGAVSRGLSQALTRSLPSEQAVDDDVDDKGGGDDDDVQPTLETVRPAPATRATTVAPGAPAPVVLPAPASVPLPGAAPAAGARSSGAPLVPLPGQGVLPTMPDAAAGSARTVAPVASPPTAPVAVLSTAPTTPAAHAVPSPTAPTVPSPAPTPPPPPIAVAARSTPAGQSSLALPGQALLQPGHAPVPVAPSSPLFGRPPAPPRVSAGSKVPFELRKKAERIYEQALKDQAEGRTASAVMNAKLAMNFDPTVAAYKDLHDSLQKGRAAAPRASGAGAVPRELVLFEQANDAEGRGDYARAVKLLQEAIELNPKAAALHNKIGVVLSIRLKRHDEALAHLRQAIDLEPGSVVYMNNFSKVTGLLESVLEKDPKKRKNNDDNGGRVAIRKIRPLKF